MRQTKCSECGRGELPSGEIIHIDECPYAGTQPGSVGFPRGSKGNYLNASVEKQAAELRQWQAGPR